MKGFIFAIASLVAVGAGCAAMALSRVPSSSWLRSVVAWIAGAVLAALLARYAGRRASLALMLAGVVALLATLFNAPIDGVHRWLDLGPLHINAAALVLPAVIVALATIGIASATGLAVAAIIAIVLLMQPDASQLTAFAIAVSVLFVRATFRWKAFAVAIAIAFAIAGWMRPDPLQPVPEVEEIFTLCAAVSPLLALLAGLALTAASVAPLSARHSARDAAFALCAYLLAVSLAPFVGAFPVPLVGLGMSFPIGWWLGMGLLLSRAGALASGRPVRRPLDGTGRPEVGGPAG
jgi:hypothetical protein